VINRSPIESNLPANMSLGKTFLRDVATNRGLPLRANNLAIVVAHPDDEAIGIGGSLNRLHGATVIHLTDGAPCRTDKMFRNGYETIDSYRLARHGELKAVLDFAGVPGAKQIRFAFPDQQAWSNLFEIAMRLSGIFLEIDCRLVLTHPYEGGHPDHDAAAFAVRAACDILMAQHRPPPTIVEMAYYHSVGNSTVYQKFAPGSASPETVVNLNKHQQLIKQKMFDLYVSQALVLTNFTTDEERLRIAPSYDFTLLANHGHILYESYDWNMSASHWLQLAEKASQQIARRLAE